MVKPYRPQMTVCRVIHNSLAHIKSVHFNGQKDYNLRPTDGKRNSPRSFVYLLCADVSTLCNMVDVKPIIHFHPYPLQHFATDF